MAARLGLARYRDAGDGRHRGLCAYPRGHEVRQFADHHGDVARRHDFLIRAFDVGANDYLVKARVRNAGEPAAGSLGLAPRVNLRSKTLQLRSDPGGVK
jgi:hypothetical protein